MRTRTLAALFGTIGLAAGVRAEPDSFGLGTGRTGTLFVSAGTSASINSCWALTGGADAGSTAVQVAGFGQLTAGTLVMIHQTAGVADPLQPDASVLDYSTSNVGRWELARVAAHDGGTVELTAPLVASFSPGGGQLIAVPEYSAATVQPFGTLFAPSWDGGCGGVLALLVSSTLTSDGTLSATGSGFRGGLGGFSPNTPGCVDANEPPPLGAQKGEGLVPSRYGPNQTGWGNVTSGGGGGVCRLSGGGGGGSAGPGGNGGDTVDGPRPVGGRGGAAISLDVMPNQLLFGGGGGSGNDDEGQGIRGGNGGGMIFVRAAAILGNGAFSAGGMQAANSGGFGVGAGGGGAGGTVALFSAGPLQCSAADAVGGDGGSAISIYATAPGGGGGGGRIFMMASSVACPASAQGGVAGSQTQGGSPYFGAWPTLAARDAGAGLGAIVQILEAFDAGTDAGVGPLVASVGCDCSAGSGAVLAVAAALLLLAARRRQGQS